MYLVSRYGELLTYIKEGSVMDNEMYDSVVEHLFVDDGQIFITRLTKPYQSSKVLLSGNIPSDLLNAVYKLGSDLVRNGVSAECILAVRSVVGWSLVDRKKGSRCCSLSKYGSLLLRWGGNP